MNPVCVDHSKETLEMQAKRAAIFQRYWQACVPAMQRKNLSATDIFSDYWSGGVRLDVTPSQSGSFTVAPVWGDQPSPANEQQLVRVADADKAGIKDKVDTKEKMMDVDPTFFSRVRSGLLKTRQALWGGVHGLFSGGKAEQKNLLAEIETKLLMADVGVEACEEIIAHLSESFRKESFDQETLFKSLRSSLTALLEPTKIPNALESLPLPHQPYVVLMVGVNGVGKTTTIGKLAARLKNKGLSVALAAGDTFRAAAVEQLKVWGERLEVPVISQQEGADSASVIFDAVSHAKARGIDVILADTAGRLHNKGHLMSELAKIKRVLAKLDVQFPHECLLVVDACTGQNAISQVREFHAAVTLSGIVMTKLDGTAKGGIVFALSKKFGLPIRYMGVGEKAQDLRPFVAEQFVDALLETQEQ